VQSNHHCSQTLNRWYNYYSNRTRNKGGINQRKG